MTAVVITKTARTGDATAVLFPTALADLQNDGTKIAAIHSTVDTTGTLVDPAKSQDVLAVKTTLGTPAQTADIMTLLAAVQAQYDLSSTLFTDNSGAYYVRRDVINSTTGTVTVSFTTPTGAAATPGAGLKPASTAANQSTQQSLYTASAAGTGYAVGDSLARIVILNTSTSPATVVSSSWLNVTQGTVLSSAPASSALTPTASSTNVTSSVLPTGAAQDGTDATAAVQLSGGVGIRGWLSTIATTVKGLLTVDTVVKSTAISRSGAITAGGTAQVFAAANAARRGFSVQNVSGGPLYINSIATATADQNSLLLNAGDLYETPVHHAGTGAVSIFGATTGQAFFGREF